MKNKKSELTKMKIEKCGITKIKNKFKVYLKSKWNYLDMLGCFLFFLAFVIRLVACFKSHEALFTIARYLFIFNAFNFD